MQKTHEKGLLPKVHKELLPLNNKKQHTHTQSNLKMGKVYEEVRRYTEDKQAHGSAMLFRAKH